jgi:four helix bundle protein
MEKVYKGFEGLLVYQEARAYRIRIAKIASGFPPEEKFGLMNQIKRSSRSVTANLAEGYGRYHYKEFIQFCRQARGSLMETLEHLICAFDEGYIPQEVLKECKTIHHKILGLLNGFISYLQNQLRLSLAKKDDLPQDQ